MSFFKIKTSFSLACGVVSGIHIYLFRKKIKCALVGLHVTATRTVINKRPSLLVLLFSWPTKLDFEQDMRAQVWINSNKFSCILSFARQKKSFKLHGWHDYGVFSHMIFFHMRLYTNTHFKCRAEVNGVVCLFAGGQGNMNEMKISLHKSWAHLQTCSVISSHQCKKHGGCSKDQKKLSHLTHWAHTQSLTGGICWPVLHHACRIGSKFWFQSCPNRSAWWRLECAATYLRWLCGQMAGDVTHPDISEASLRLASAAAALPSSSLPTCRPSTAFTLQLWHTGT